MPDEQLPGDTPDGVSDSGGGGWRMARAVAGVAMISIGVIGCVLPVIPGVPLVIGGVALLGTRHPLVRPFTERFERWRRRSS